MAGAADPSSCFAWPRGVADEEPSFFARPGEGEAPAEPPSCFARPGGVVDEEPSFLA